jgi:flagellar hook protein FlgE
MKSLWSGVSGLQAHQIAMDVEGHNIANVNTVGFKYSRANFSDMLSQTMKIATSPQGDIGGKNDMQVGLGTNVVSTTKIFSQGSTQNTDKNTDMTIQGDGFFIVSADGGANYNYTRNGDFNLDSNGTLVDSNGFAVQGWKKEIVSDGEGCTSSADAGLVDSTQPIESIQIEPGLKIPANTTSNIELKANLNSGESVESKDCVYPSDATDGLAYSKQADNLQVATNFNGLFNSIGKSLSLDSTTDAVNIESGTGIVVTDNTSGVDYFFVYTDESTVAAQTTSPTADYDGDGNNDTYFFKSPNDLKNALESLITTDLTVPSTTAKVQVSGDTGQFTIDNSATGTVKLNLSVRGFGGGTDYNTNVSPNTQPNSLGNPAFTALFRNFDGTINTSDITTLADMNEIVGFDLVSAKDTSDAAIKNATGITLEDSGGNIAHFVYTDGSAVSPSYNSTGPTISPITYDGNDAYFFTDITDLEMAMENFLAGNLTSNVVSITDGKIDVTGAASTISKVENLTGAYEENTEFLTVFQPLVSGSTTPGITGKMVAEGTIKNSEEVKTKSFVSNEDVAVLFDANGDALSLQSATVSTYDNQTGLNADGQGIRITIGGIDSSGASISREVTFRYTDGDISQNHPAATEVINSGTGHQLSYECIRDDDGNIISDRPVYFNTLDDLRYQIQQIARDINSDGQMDTDVDVTINSNGKIELQHNGTDDSQNISLGVSAIEDDNTTENVLFTQSMSSITGTLEAGKIKTSQALNAATHATSIEVYDSLGSKHSLRFEFRKVSSNEWAWRAEVPKPGTLTGATPEGNILRGGLLSFNEDGSLRDVNPPTLTFTANNGSRADQIIQLDFGSLGGFDGITSLVKSSSTEGISQDGYPSGDLLDIRVDQTGTVMGSFTNGRSLALAQVALAKFTNNAGLTAEGSNLFSQTSNSGDPTIGTAGTGGRGSILASALEMSNVDLSRSLTELIVVQRGYQANSKTITTSDQMLQALLAIKK